MIITIIGWYGTETIGDRAIFAGLLSFIAKTYDSFEIKLGSLYPFFSERTVSEDSEFYKEITGREFPLSLFASKSPKELDKAISTSDIVVMGGGPLMHIDELYIIEYAFKKAMKLGKKTALLGCGIGPLFTKKHRKCVTEIVKNSSLVILRDKTSKTQLLQIFCEFNQKVDTERILTSFDPAVECALQFNRLEPAIEQVKNYIAINLRKFPTEYARDDKASHIDNALLAFVKHLSDSFPNENIHLVPMHYFHIGGDDREFLNYIRLAIKRDRLYVHNHPLSLVETMRTFKDASFNIGMRFHSVVLQTIINGNNFILDYTEPAKGKISGFLKDIDPMEFYSQRYACLQTEGIKYNFINSESISQHFKYDLGNVNKALSAYVSSLRGLF